MDRDHGASEVQKPPMDRRRDWARWVNSAQTQQELAGDEVRVHPPGCIGCGLCQQHCPTEPKSITVIPVAARGG